MASIVWMTIFAFLILELVVTLVVCVPVPRNVRNIIARSIFKLNPTDRLGKPILFIGIGLSLALVESYLTHQRIVHRLLEEQKAGVGTTTIHHHDWFYPGLHDKERKYKSERNMYLAGFALTLLFVLGRILVLLQESVELHEETERVKKDLSTKATTAAASKKGE